MKKIIVLLFLINIAIYPQVIDLFPGNLNIQPFAANTLEPKIGFLFQLSNNELRLDIGNSIDIIQYKTGDNSTWSFGADFFTFTLLRGEKNFHFPVDAVDYFFGINGSYKKIENNFEYGARLRISHISAHFVDGHFDGSNGQWRDGLNPRVYSREFIEIIPFVKFNSFRVHCGFAYLFHVTPNTLGKDSYQFGFDYFGKEFPSDNFTPFVAYDFKLVNMDKYSANHSFVTGIKFGKPEGRGISIYFNYYSGKSIHGQYFDFNKTYSAIGINMDL